MPKKDTTINMAGTINPKIESGNAKKATKLLETYSVSDLSKDKIRCPAGS